MSNCTLDSKEIAEITGGRCCVCYCSNYRDIAIGRNTVDAGDCTYAWNRYYTWITQNECGL